MIPFKAYIIVAALSALIVAALLTLTELKEKLMHWSLINLLWSYYLFNKIFYDFFT